MSRWFTMIAGATAVVTTLACSGMGGGGAANQAACKAWVEKQNALPCYKIAQMDVDQSCPEALDLAGDMVAYYECMADGVECNGDIPDAKGQMDCAALQKF